MLEITRERIYGGPLGGPSRHVYRARVKGDEVATGETRAQATENAWSAIADAMSVKWTSPVLGRAESGETCVGVLTGAREYSLYWYNADGTGRSGCECGRLELYGVKCTLAEYVRYSVLMRNGVDCYDAAKLAVAQEVTTNGAL